MQKTGKRKLIIRGNVSLKALIPQLQTTFLKSLTDVNKTVRMQSAICIGHLMNINVGRVDILLNELCTNLTSGSAKVEKEKGVKECILYAMYEVLDKINNNEGKNIISNDMCEKIMTATWNIIIKSKEEEDENEARIASQCLALLLIKHISSDLCKLFLNEHLLSKHKAHKLGSSLALSCLLRVNESWSMLKANDGSSLAMECIEFYLNDDYLPVKKYAIDCFVNLTSIAKSDNEVRGICFSMLEKVGDAMSCNNSILISDSLVAFKRLAKYSTEELYKNHNLSVFCSIVVPHLFSTSPSIKLQAEGAIRYGLCVNEKKHENALNKLNAENEMDKKKLQQLTEYVNRVISKTSTFHNSYLAVSDSE